MIMLPSSFQLETCIIIGDNHRSRDSTRRNKKKGSNGMYFVNAMLYSSSTFRPSIKSIFVLEVSFDNVSSAIHNDRIQSIIGTVLPTNTSFLHALLLTCV